MFDNFFAKKQQAWTEANQFIARYGLKGAQELKGRSRSEIAGRILERIKNNEMVNISDDAPPIAIIQYCDITKTASNDNLRSRLQKCAA
jgi:hypothetical protein